MKLKIKKGDIALIVLIVIASVVGLIAGINRKSGESAEITVNGETVATYSLQSDMTLEVNGTVIEILDGKIRFASSDCPDKTCVECGWLDKCGEVAACVPNKVVIRLVGTINTEDEYDGVTG